ncbi:helix-turn-helix domain-containing protein [Aquabacterium sp.]|uniref:AraC family transcriptional regulator n=1 Tax=Aquabacterium sp. TaxID=1872578 RepID=UPI003784C82C
MSLPTPRPPLPGPRFTVRSYHDEGGVHAHAHAQAVLPLHGSMQLVMGGQQGEVRSGQGVLIPAGLAHDFDASGPNRFVVLDFDCELATGRFFALDGGLSHLLAYVQSLAARSSLPPDVQRHAGALLSEAVRERAGPPAPAGSALVQQALALMQQRLAESWRVDSLAAALGCSARQLHDAFRHLRQQGPAECLAELRLEAATALLRHGALPIAEIALRCGYSEQSALTRAMRRRWGQTPAALRRAARGAGP